MAHLFFMDDSPKFVRISGVTTWLRKFANSRIDVYVLVGSSVSLDVVLEK